MTVIAVIGARGGVGTSTIALELARHLRTLGERVNLIDSDPWIELVSDSSELISPHPTISVIAACRHEDLPELDRAILVVPCEVRAITNAVLLATELERRCLVSLVVRTPGSTPISPEKIATLLRLRLAAVIKNDPKISLLGEHGARVVRGLQKSIEELVENLQLR